MEIKNWILPVMVVAMMVVSPLMVTVDTASGEPTDDEKDQVREDMKLVDNGDGTYTLKNKYLEDKFGLSSMTESDIYDVLGTNPATSEPQEIVEWYGSPENSHGVYDIVSGAVVKDPVTAGVNTDSHHSVGFSAALSKGLALDDDGGLHKQDWFCSLYYDNDTGALTLAVSDISGTKSSKISVDEAAGLDPLSLDTINLVSSMQSRNILNYAVGDFDGDGNEEIAVHHHRDIYIFGIDSGYKLNFLYKVALPPLADDCHNALFTPVSMAAGDPDRDLAAELVVARGYIHNYEVGNEQTVIICIDVNQRTGGVRPSNTLEIYDSPWETLTFKDPNNEASTLDSVMTSVAMGDVDNDGRLEVVIGGYLWDISSRGDPSYYNNPERSAGELYLSYFEYEEFTGASSPWNKPTILMDDNGMATTRFISGNSDFEKKYVLNGNHNRVDTSIYLHDYGDYSDNPKGLCRSVNWSNWTVPLCAGSLSGFQNSTTCDQVFFDTWFYNLILNADGTYSFTVYQETPKLTMVMDNNNVMCSYLGFETLYDQNVFSYSGQEEVIIHYAADLEDKTVDTEGNEMNGATEWAYVIYDMDGGVFNAKYSTGTARTYHDIREWGENGLYNVGRVFVGNYDNDTYYADILAKMTMYSDPMVIAFISGIPYEQDLVDQLQKPGALGSTTFSKYASKEEDKSTTLDYNGGGWFAIDSVFQLSLEAGYTSSLVTSTTISVEITEMYSSSEDSVALMIVPTEFYYYRVFEPVSNNQYKMSIQIATQVLEETVTIMGYGEYCDVIDNYNEMGQRFFADGFIPLGKVEINDHITGDISSYKYVPPDSTGAIETQNVSYGTTGKLDGDEPVRDVCVDVGSATGRTVNDGYFINAEVGGQALFGAGALGGFEKTAGAGTIDATGEGFSSTMYKGFASYYRGDEGEYDEVMSQYWMEGKFWAETRTIDNSGEISEYMHVGYAVTRYGLGAALATLSPENQPGEVYGPTDDAVCLYLEHPNAGVDLLAVAESYSLETNWHDTGWEKVGGLADAGIRIEMMENGEWKPCDGTFQVDNDREDATGVWIRISGLSSVTDTSFDFRIVGYKDADKNVYTPSIPVTAYKDTRVKDAHQIAVGAEAGIGSHLRTIDGRQSIVIDTADVAGVVGQRMLALSTVLSAGDRADVYLEDRGRVDVYLEDGDTLRHIGSSVSNSNGVFYLEYEGETDRAASIALGAAFAVVTSLVVAGVVAFRVRP